MCGVGRVSSLTSVSYFPSKWDNPGRYNSDAMPLKTSHVAFGVVIILLLWLYDACPQVAYSLLVETDCKLMTLYEGESQKIAT